MLTQTLNDEQHEKIFSQLKNVYNNKSYRVRVNNLPRLGEDYSYKIKDNCELDKIESNLKVMDSILNQELKNIREVGIVDLEFRDSIYTAVKSGIAFTGKRRSRKSDTPIPCDLMEYDFTAMVPSVIYLIQGINYDESNLKSKYSEEEWQDLQALWLCLMGSTYSQTEKERLIEYMERDEVLNEFYHSLFKFVPKRMGTFQHPKVLDSKHIFDEVEVVIEDEMDILYYHLRSILIPIVIYYVESMLRYNQSEIPYLSMIRSIDGYRMILEVDRGCGFDPVVVTPSSRVFQPKITTILKSEQAYK